MTRTQMLECIKDLGGLNPRTALIVSIGKWKILHQYWNNLCNQDIMSKHWPKYYNCALCELYCVSYYDTCGECPLITKDLDIGCDDYSYYYKAIGAIQNNNYKGFRYWQQKLVLRMEKALAKLR